LTLLETVIALGVLAVLLIGLSGLFLRLLAGAEKSNDTSAGLLVAERLLQQECNTGKFQSSPPQSTLLYTHSGEQAQEFLYQVTCSPMQVTAGGKPIYYVDVQVWWSGGSRAGQGRLSTRAGRLVTP
jgi:Tfp pilus assembly protein PilV